MYVWREDHLKFCAASMSTNFPRLALKASNDSKGILRSEAMKAI
jgi:hypothetical protein